MSIWLINRARGGTTFLLLLLLVLCHLPAVAQSVQGEPADLKFEIINATTGEPGTIDRMTIDYVSARRNGIIDFEPSGSSFIAPAVPIKDGGQYIVAVWHQGVPYWWSVRGRELTSKTTTLHIFDTTSELQNVSITGLNLVIRRQETLLRLEYMVQVSNTTSPQKTVSDRVATFELDFPPDATSIEATYRRGPDPTPFPADTRGSRRLSLAVPLTPGQNQIRIEAVLPWQEGMEIPMGSDLDIASWSLLASPEWLEVRAMELESGPGEKLPGFNRMSGPALEAGRHFPLQLFSGEHEATEATDLFTQDSPAAANATDAADADGEGPGGFSLPLLLAGALIVIVIVAAIRRRR
jgi:hypothetical protein